MTCRFCGRVLLAFRLSMVSVRESAESRTGASLANEDGENMSGDEISSQYVDADLLEWPRRGI